MIWAEAPSLRVQRLRSTLSVLGCRGSLGPWAARRWQGLKVLCGFTPEFRANLDAEAASGFGLELQILDVRELLIASGFLGFAGVGLRV